MSDILVQQGVESWKGFNSFNVKYAMTLLPRTEDHSHSVNLSADSRGKPSGEEQAMTSSMKEEYKKTFNNVKRTFSIDESSTEEGTEKKKQRVENIVTSICAQPRSPKMNDLAHNSAERLNKRKMFVPQQHGTASGESDVRTDDGPQEICPSSPKDLNHNSTTVDQAEKEKALLRDQLKIMGDQLQKMQQRYQEVLEKREMERYELMSRIALLQPHIEFEAYLRTIKTEISQSVKAAISDAFERSLPVFKEKMQMQSPRDVPKRDQRDGGNFSNITHADLTSKQSSTQPMAPAAPVHQPMPHPLANTILPLSMYYGSHGSFNSGLPSSFNVNMMSNNALQHAIENEMVENHLFGRDLSKKQKRTKVTDTRLSPRISKLNENLLPMSKQDNFEISRTFEGFGAGSSLFPNLNPAMAAMQTAALLNGFCPRPDSIKSGTRSPTNISDMSERMTSSPEINQSMTSSNHNVTLTPIHLRKAKLMFFYVRYPSSVLLKTYFCDVHFNKNNTAQLVKWFSNFREFYYIQMEKYSRQAIAEGLSAEQVETTTDSELYKVLNLHYNRNNQIEVPKSFLETIQVTLKEFIRAISLGKDREQSWKKPIYKIIARLDDTVPEYFKSQAWVEQLTD